MGGQLRHFSVMLVPFSTSADAPGPCLGGIASLKAAYYYFVIIDEYVVIITTLYYSNSVTG